MYPSSHQQAEGKVLSTSGNIPEVSLLGCEAAESTTCTALLKVYHHFLPLLHKMVSWCWLFLFLVLCGVSIDMFVHVRVRARNSNGTTVRTFSNFNLLHGRCTLLPFPSALTSLCAPG